LSDDEQLPAGFVHPFVAKVDLNQLVPLWIKHFTMSAPSSGGSGSAEALSCTVTHDTDGKNIIYVGGTVEGGSAMDDADGSSMGDDDIFVASMDGGAGTINWMKQMGSSGNDRLAVGQGLDVDSQGNAIVYAETSGSFYDQHSGSSNDYDLVVMTMNKLDGTYLPGGTFAENAPDTMNTSNGPAGVSVGNDEATNTIVGDEYHPVDKQVAEMDQSNDEPTILPDSIIGIQTDEAVPSYAGGMYYDSYTNTAYVTGATYENKDKEPKEQSQCLFTAYALPALKPREIDVLGTDAAPAACSAISLTSWDEVSQVVIAGSTEKGGLLDDLNRLRKFQQYGILLNLMQQPEDPNSNPKHYGVNFRHSHGFRGGAAIDEQQVQYPVSVVTDGGYVYVVSMASRDDAVTADFQKADGKQYPNFTTGGIKKYGADYEILVERHTLMTDYTPVTITVQTMDLDWRKPLETADKKSILVSGMITVYGGDALVIVGSTVGTDGPDLNGIMAKVKTSDGSFYGGQGDSNRAVAYFSSVSNDDDWIMNVCNDPDDPKVFYIVGATGGEMDKSVTKSKGDKAVHAVISKINADNLEIIWTAQYGVTHASGKKKEKAASVALGCAVIPGSGRIYVAGNVENGAVLEGADSSAGGDDIFVSMLSKNAGEKIWTKQVGSNGDDRLARGNGIAADMNGNALVYGDTTGDFHRDRGNTPRRRSDLFLMIFDQKSGAYQPSLSDQSTSSNQINNNIDSESAPSEWFGSRDKMNSSTSSAKKSHMNPKIIFIIVGVLAGCALLAVSFVFCLRRRKKKKSDMMTMNSIFKYLQGFDVEDVDLRKSPPGGWHGTYLNKLAEGYNEHSASSFKDSPDVDTFDDEHNEKEDEVLFEKANRVSSIKGEESLFMGNNAARPQLGANGGGYRDDALSERSEKFSIA
jgi:hypothetical protein